MADSLYSPDLRRPLSQGDVIGAVRIEEAHLGQKARTYSVMAISHSCEIDKAHNKLFLAASVRPLADFSPADHQGIRDGRNLSLFYLPPHPPAITTERCVDLRQIFRVAFSSIGATGFIPVFDDTTPQRIFDGEDPRMESLSDFGIATLQGRLVAFFTRSRDLEPDRQGRFTKGDPE